MTRLPALLLALLAFGLALAPAMPALAQNDILQIIRRDYQRGQQLFFWDRPERSAPPPVVRAKPSKARASPFAAPKPAAPKEEPKPAIPPSLFVHVLGDSLADMLADGLKAQLEDRPDIAVVPHTKASSGFVRTDYHDWQKAAGDLLASGERIDAAVIMIGANDRQQIKEGEATLELRSDEWRAAYVRRVDALLALLKQRGIRIFWVGLPPMKNQKLTADMVWFNEIYRERVEAAGGTYIDIWDGFVDVDGSYVATGPDLKGQMAKLRAGDGVHFSKAGSRLAAHYVERELRRVLGDAPVIAAPSSTTPLATPGSLVTGPISAADLALVPSVSKPGEAPQREKPEFGPVMPLVVVEPAPGAVLLGGGAPDSAGGAAMPVAATGAPSPAADPTAAKVLVRGEPLAAKEGRADDFRWPRPASSPGPQRTTSRAVDGPAMP
jgi:hypothetical protein